MSNQRTNQHEMIPANWGSFEDTTTLPPTAPRIHSYNHGITRERNNHLTNTEIGRYGRSNSDTRIRSNNNRSWPFQPHRPISFRPHETSGVDQDTWRLFEDRVRTGPYGLNRFPSHPFSPVRIIFLDRENSPEVVNPNLQQFIQESPRRIRGEWNRNLSSSTDDETNLTRDEQNKAVNKLKKQVYNPYPKNKNNNWSLYYRDSKLEHQDDDGKSCAICLEDFEPREEVVTTPCKHMFHEECILRWVKSNGQCPVCRHVIIEKKKEQTRAASSNSNSSHDLISLIRAMEEAFQWVNVPR
ncbi:RING-type E3 ubiquitin transferase [Ranunculus cassubicifolius]